MICVLISRIFFQILLNTFLKILIPKVKPIAFGIFYRLKMRMTFQIHFETISRKLVLKLMKFIYARGL